MNSVPISQMDDSQIQHLVLALESLRDGDLAIDLLVACGERAVAPLENLLLRSAARTIALPRCRAASALGRLQAYRTLIAYFEARALPSDPAVLFSEDAVRSTVACELLRWKSGEVFQTLLRAAAQRGTLGIIEALGEFRRPEAVPILFETLEDDLCRHAAVDALTKMPEQTRHYAMLSLREKTRTTLIGPAAMRRRRATAELLHTLGISIKEWQEIRDLLLDDEDASIVVSAAAAGFCVANEEDFSQIVWALFRVADKLNCLQEEEVIRLLKQHRKQADDVAEQIVDRVRAKGRHGSWLSPMWRILWHLGYVSSEKAGMSLHSSRASES